jgi:hypothetical protein
MSVDGGVIMDEKVLAAFLKRVDARMAKRPKK